MINVKMLIKELNKLPYPTKGDVKHIQVDDISGRINLSVPNIGGEAVKLIFTTLLVKSI